MSDADLHVGIDLGTTNSLIGAVIDGKPRLFAEPPHMQASMLFLPHGAHVPDVGDEVELRVRFTATDFDQTVVS